METNYLYNDVEVNYSFLNDKMIIAGPCTFSSYEEVYSIAKELKSLGLKYFRAGAYKGRTNPYSFQGLQDEGIEILLKIKEELDYFQQLKLFQRYIQNVYYLFHLKYYL